MINKFPRIIFAYMFVLTGCVDRDGLAPVEESKWRAVDLNVAQYRVVKGDTLYSVAFRYDLDYQRMAEYNHLRSPYTLHIGQVLRLRAQGSQSEHIRPLRLHQYTTSTRLKPISIPQRATIPNYNSSVGSAWSWPAHGRVVENFSPQRGIKGINIEGKKGDKIYASSSGVVAYAGNGLAGYGNLIIIKHNDQFLTAYGNNLQNRVHEGQTIQKGQVIADMGLVDRKYWGVHFEIRQLGKPVNPLSGFLK